MIGKVIVNKGLLSQLSASLALGTNFGIRQKSYKDFHIDVHSSRSDEVPNDRDERLL